MDPARLQRLWRIQARGHNCPDAARFDCRRCREPRRIFARFPPQRRQGIGLQPCRSRHQVLEATAPWGRIDCFEVWIPSLGWVVASSFSDSKFRKPEEEAIMPTEKYCRRAAVAAPDGLPPALKAKSRARRLRQRARPGRPRRRAAAL